jgi:hypothetical protein
MTCIIRTTRSRGNVSEFLKIQLRYIFMMNTRKQAETSNGVAGLRMSLSPCISFVSSWLPYDVHSSVRLVLTVVITSKCT